MYSTFYPDEVPANNDGNHVTCAGNHLAAGLRRAPDGRHSSFSLCCSLPSRICLSASSHLHPPPQFRFGRSNGYRFGRLVWFSPSELLSALQLFSFSARGTRLATSFPHAERPRVHFSSHAMERRHRGTKQSKKLRYSQGGIKVAEGGGEDRVFVC